MISKAQRAIIKKDMREAMSNKMVKVALIIMPIAMVVFLPVLFTVMGVLAPEELADLAPVLSLLPIPFAVDEIVKGAYYYIMNFMMPMFFLMIPIMAAAVSAGSSFVGEKERMTLETILFSPLTVNQLFAAKVLGALSVALIVTGISFAGYIAIAIVGSVLIYGSFVLSIPIWLVIMCLLVPSISLIGVTVMVLASARAKSFQEAQQYGALLILPIMLFFVLPQVTGLFVYGTGQLALLGAVFLVIALVLTRLASARFTPEKLLK